MSSHEDVYEEKRCVHCDKSIHLPDRCLRDRVQKPGKYYKVCQGCHKPIKTFNVVIIKKTWRDFCGFWVRDLKYEIVGAVSKKERTSYCGLDWEYWQDQTDNRYLSIWQVR